MQAILDQIRASGEAQVREIEQGAQSQVNGILAQARAEARQVEEDACAEASAPAVAERARILHRARLESLRVVGDVRESLVDTALARARERLASLRADPSYPSALRALAEEALAELASGGQAQLLADPRDRSSLNRILTDLKLDGSVSYELNCLGGLIAESADGRVVVINTFESRLERATSFLRRYLAALFEEEHPEAKQVELIKE
ncbi:MAG: V-type ATP synthase subunit E [Chloroflexota bacterium]